MKKIYTILAIICFASGSIFAQSIEFSSSDKSVGSSKESVTIGVKEINNENIVNIYSYNSNVYINNTNNSKVDIIVYDILGKEVSKKQFENTTLYKLDLNDCYPGFYIIKAKVDNKFYVKKIYVE